MYDITRTKFVTSLDAFIQYVFYVFINFSVI